jgi:hypothetical protein
MERKLITNRRLTCRRSQPRLARAVNREARCAPSQWFGVVQFDSLGQITRHDTKLQITLVDLACVADDCRELVFLAALVGSVVRGFGFSVVCACLWLGFIFVSQDMITMFSKKSPEPTAVGAFSSAVAVHATGRRWLSFFR